MFHNFVENSLESHRNNINTTKREVDIYRKRIIHSEKVKTLVRNLSAYVI